MTNTRTFNDNSHSFKRRKRRITDDGHSRLVSIGSTCSSLYCSCCSALCSEYCRSTTSSWTSQLIFFQRAPFSGCFWSPCWSLGCSERKFCLQQADGPLSMGNALEQRNHGISPTGESTDPRTVSSRELHVQLLGKSRGGLPSFADLTRAPRPDPAGDGEQAAALRERCRTASTGGGDGWRCC